MAGRTIFRMYTDFEPAVRQTKSPTLSPIHVPLLYCQLNTHLVPHSKHTPYATIKTNMLMVYREIIAVCSEIHTKYIHSVGRT